jgi:hypothetical protein
VDRGRSRQEVNRCHATEVARLIPRPDAEVELRESPTALTSIINADVDAVGAWNGTLDGQRDGVVPEMWISVAA